MPDNSESEDDLPPGVRRPGAPEPDPVRPADTFDTDYDIDEQTEPGPDFEINPPPPPPPPPPPLPPPGGARGGAADNYGPVNPAREDASRIEAAEDKLEGNYIFTVGLAGRGKSTFQRHLMWYLEKGLADVELGEEERLAEARYRHHVQPNRQDRARVTAFEALRAQWGREFLDQRFPERTKIADVTEFYFDVEPLMEKATGSLEFGFFELSGEHFLNIYLSKAGKAQRRVPAKVERLLKSSCQICFVFLASGASIASVIDKDKNEQVSDDDAFEAFLEYLSDLDNPDFARRTSVALVISYPEAVKQRILDKILRDERLMPVAEPTTDEDRLALHDLRRAVAQRYTKDELKDLFLRAFFPKTSNAIKRWQKRSKRDPSRGEIFLFAVGDVSLDPSNPVNDRVVTPHFQDAEYFYEWMYYRFTGKQPTSEPWSEAFVRWISKIGTGG